MKLVFEPVGLPGTIPALRHELREFLKQELKPLTALERAHALLAFEPEFSKKLGQRGYIGMGWSKQYGGHERTPLERHVVLEELLAHGAPLGAHWMADRSCGPLLQRYGSESQRERLLPRIARGELYFCSGTSEPQTEADLATLRSEAKRTDGGFRLTGQKTWVTHGDRADFMIALVRTRPLDAQAPQAGLSQLLIDMKAPGVTVRPIVDLTGDAHHSDVFFEEVAIPADALIGTEGEGWAQCMSEVSLAQCGPDRYLSSFHLFSELLRVVGPVTSEVVRVTIGRLTSQLWSLRQMSLSLAGALAAGRDCAVEAAIVKDLGCSFEQEVPRAVQTIGDSLKDSQKDAAFLAVWSYMLQVSPTFSLLDGARESLRDGIAKGLALP